MTTQIGEAAGWRHHLIAFAFPAKFKGLFPPRHDRRNGHHADRVPGFLIPLSQVHLKRILHKFGQYYNSRRPHSALGP